jgi:hypothetical protein
VNTLEDWQAARYRSIRRLESTVAELAREAEADRGLMAELFLGAVELHLREIWQANREINNLKNQSED